MKVTKATYHWQATGHVPEGDIGVNYVISNMAPPIQKLRNRRMWGTIWEEHDDKAAQYHYPSAPTTTNVRRSLQCWRMMSRVAGVTR